MFKKEEIIEKLKKINLRQKITVVNVIFYGMIIYAVINCVGQEFKLREYDRKIERYEENIATQKEILSEYKSKIKEQNTEEIMEELARKQGYIKPSEKIYIDINK